MGTMHAKLIEPVPNLQTPAEFGSMSLQELRERLRSKIKAPEAKPRMVTVKEKTPGMVYLVCENSFDPVAHTVEVFRAADPSEAKEIVKWKDCTLVKDIFPE